MRIIALLTVYNERRYIRACLEHLISHGVHIYLCDNESTDETATIAREYLGRGVIGIETLPRSGVMSLRRILEREEQLAAELEADWFMHVDADEFRLPPNGGTLADALARVDAEGFNAVNFLEFTFVPVRESPDHDHPDFRTTMRWYYPYLPIFPHRLNAWKRQPGPVNLAAAGGHRIRFPGLRMAPDQFRMRHYQFLSVPHAIEKWVRRGFDTNEVRVGWHDWRARLRPDQVRLPSSAHLRTYSGDDSLDPSRPRRSHYLEAATQRPHQRLRAWLVRNVRGRISKALG
jgi:glycosyltransferase involved in cell wall biosynthesis